MGVPADERSIQHRCRKYVIGILRQQGEVLRHPLPPHCADRVTLQADGAGLRATQPRERQQGERLAAAVAAQDGDEFATQKAQREALDEHPSGHADAEPG